MRKALSAVVTTVAFGLAAPAWAEEYPSMTLKMAHFAPSSFTGSKVDKWFADEIKKRSGGKIKIQIFWSESMGKANEVLDLVASGAMDLGATSPGYFPNKLPLTGATNSVMMQFGDNGSATIATAELVEKFPAVREELKRANVLPIYFHSLNAYRLFCNKEVKSIGDFQGLKIRSWGEYIPVMWEALGATPVSLMTPDLYESLQRGTVDCAFWPHELNYSLKLYEVAKYTWSGNDHFGAIPTWPVWVSWKTWHEKWPESVRKLFLEVGKEAMAKDIAAVKEDEEKALRAMVDKHGVKVVPFADIDKVRAKVPDMAKVWAEKMDAKGIGKEAREISEFWKKRAAELESK